jgi:hypothetical protein
MGFARRTWTFSTVPEWACGCESRRSMLSWPANSVVGSRGIRGTHAVNPSWPELRGGFGFR